MTKRLLAALVCVALAISLLPKTALAAGPGSAFINSVELKSGTPYYENGATKAQSTDSGIWNARYNPSKGVLT